MFPHTFSSTDQPEAPFPFLKNVHVLCPDHAEHVVKFIILFFFTKFLEFLLFSIKLSDVVSIVVAVQVVENFSFSVGCLLYNLVNIYRPFSLEDEISIVAGI